MAGIVKSTSKRIVVNKKMREIITPTATLDTALFFSDAVALGASVHQPTYNSEANRLPTIVKNEAELCLLNYSITVGTVQAFNGNTKTVEILTFERGSSSTSTRSDGVMVLNSPNVARVHTDPGLMQLQGFLFEPASTNLLTDSGVLNGVSSFSTRSSVGLTHVDTGWNVGNLLEKGMKLDQLTEVVYAYKGYTFTAGTSYVFSFYVKLSDGALPLPADFRVNIQGDTLYLNNPNINIESKGNGIYQISVPFVGKAAPSYVGVAKYSNDSSKSLVVTGFQVEEGLRKTSYIPTTTASATRLADKLVGNRPISTFQYNSWYMESDRFTGWFGNYVTKGRNILPNSNANTYFAGYQGATLVKTDNVVVTEWGATDANRVVSSGGSSGIRVLQQLLVPAVGEKVTVSGWFKNNGTTAFHVYSNQGARADRIEPGQQKRVLWEAIEGNGVGSVQFQVNPTNINDNVDFTWWRLQVEKSATVTPWTPDPADFIKIAGNGTLEISAAMPIAIRSLSLVARQLKDSEY